ncbi:MAG: TetR/AcrR family transcriptional regulator [Thermoleophilia bacterium]
MGRGRKREFDIDEALDRAVDLFWRQGYEGTSVADLSAVMGISPSSMYGAFGSKRELFDRVLARYGARQRPMLDEAMSAATAAAAARALLVGAARAATEPGRPAGCLTIQGGMACDDETRQVAETLAAARAATQERMRLRFERGIAEGDVAPDADGDALARYVATVAQGIVVQAAGGATREQLVAVAEAAAGSLALVARPAAPA